MTILKKLSILVSNRVTIDRSKLHNKGCLGFTKIFKNVKGVLRLKSF